MHRLIYLVLSFFLARTAKHILETCLLTCALAAALVMAGTGDLDLLRRLRRIRARLMYDKTSSLGYGSHLTCHMAIGLLFLGGTRMSLRNDTLDSVACLYCSVFPRFPNSTSDNRFHMQALRHFWTAAVDENRLLETRIDENLLLSVPIEIRPYQTVSNDNPAKDSSFFQTPALLPRIEHPFIVFIRNPLYSSQSFSFDRMGDASSTPYIHSGPLRLFLKPIESFDVDHDGNPHPNRIPSIISTYRSASVKILHPILDIEHLQSWIDSEILNAILRQDVTVADTIPTTLTGDISSLINTPNHPSHSSFSIPTHLDTFIIRHRLMIIDQSILVLNQMISTTPSSSLFSLEKLVRLKNLYHSARLHLWNWLISSCSSFSSLPSSIHSR